MFGGGMGGMGGMGGGPRRKPRRGQDSTSDYNVTLKDLYMGRTTHFNVSRQILCPSCNATGGRPGATAKECVKCQGKGRCLQMRSMGNGMVAQSFAMCDECQGEGTKVRDKDKCRKCKGTRTTQQKKVLELYIPRGSREGERIILAGEADQDPDDSEPGDIIFECKPAIRLRHDTANHAYV